MPIYLQIEGIPGDATQQDHKGWTDIKSLSWNLVRDIGTKVGSATNREGSQPSFDQVVLFKVSDSSTPKLIADAASGRIGKPVQIHLVTSGNPGNTYLEFTLSNVLIASYGITSDGDRPMERIALDFTKIETKYTPYDNANVAQGPIISSFDVSSGQVA